MPVAPITYDKFDGGITDNYLCADRNRYYAAENVLVDRDGNLYSRDGLSIYDSRVPGDTNGAKSVTGVYFGASPWDDGIAILGRRVYRGTAFTEILGYDGNPALPNKNEGGNENGVFWRKQFIVCPNGYGFTSTSHTHPQRLYCTTLHSAYKSVQLGLPALALGSMVATPGVGAGTYIYRIHLRYTLTDYEGTTFEEDGPLLEVTVASAATPDSNDINFTNISVLSSSAVANYDTANIKIRFYRTLNAGTVFYFVGEITNGTTTFNDANADTAILANELIYTDGDVLENTAPPQDALYVTAVNDFFWYATPKSVTHSKAGAPGAVPAEYEEFLGEPVKGLSECAGYPILFCEREVFRIEGNYDEQGGGGFTLRRIHASAGCMSARSVVKVNEGLAWAGNGGFYFTDGFQVVKLTTYLDQRFKTWRNNQMTGAFDPNKNIVMWTVCTENGSRHVVGSTTVNDAYSDAIAVWDVSRGVRPDAVFTTFNFGGNIYPSALHYEPVNSRMYLGDARGYLLYFDPLRHADPRIVPSEYPSNYFDTAIVWDFISVGFNNEPATRDYATHVTVEAEAQGDVSLRIYHRRDDWGPWESGSDSRVDGGCIWNITDLVWGEVEDEMDVAWLSSKMIQGKHYIPPSTRRAQRRQIRLTNATIDLYCSDDVCTATVAVGTTASPFPTVTLNDATMRWCDSPEEYFIAFEDDAFPGTYTDYYKIRSRVSDTQITLYDPYRQVPLLSGDLTTKKWQIKGVRKYERMSLMSLSIFHEQEGTTQEPGQSPSNVNA